MKISYCIIASAILFSQQAFAVLATLDFNGLIASPDSDIRNQGYAIGRHDIFSGYTFSGSLEFNIGTSTFWFSGTTDTVVTREAYRVPDINLSITIDDRPEAPYNATTTHSLTATQNGQILIRNDDSAFPRDRFEVYAFEATGDLVNDRFTPRDAWFDWRFGDSTEVFDTTDLLEAMTQLDPDTTPLGIDESRITIRHTDTSDGSFESSWGYITDFTLNLLAPTENVLLSDVTPDVTTGFLDVYDGLGDASNAGALSVKVGDGVDGTLTASYEQTSGDETDLSAFNFKLAGNTLQVWDLDFSGTGFGVVELIFKYDDSGMGLEEELALSIFHELEGGGFEDLGGIVDTDLNTITTSTTSFSDFYAGIAFSTPLGIPEPTTLALLALGLASLGHSQRKKLH